MIKIVFAFLPDMYVSLEVGFLFKERRDSVFGNRR
jgi:hypothetical protein